MSWNTYLDSHQDRFVDALADFIAIPSVSAQHAHFEDVVRAGNWVIDRLHDAGDGQRGRRQLPGRGRPLAPGPRAQLQPGGDHTVAQHVTALSTTNQRAFHIFSLGASALSTHVCRAMGLQK